MPVVAVLRLDTPGSLLARTSRAVPGAVIRVEYQLAEGELLVSATGGDLQGLETALEEDPTVAERWAVFEGEERRVYGVTVGLDRPLLSELTTAGHGPDLGTAEGIELLQNEIVDGVWTLTLALPDRSSVGALGTFGEEHDLSLRVDGVFVEASPDASGGYGLTDSQREGLVVAHERGYFEDPRRVTLAELADDMDVSPSALGRRMRRALDALIESTLADR